mmetsp:Transcript_50958/g.103598  ORF Transcript_50958/g.103598 Transcript_50958/m.103598 type:complete len:283 (-) Transcript_50958:3731-4579(-)
MTAVSQVVWALFVVLVLIVRRTTARKMEIAVLGRDAVVVLGMIASPHRATESAALARVAMKMGIVLPVRTAAWDRTATSARVRTARAQVARVRIAARVRTVMMVCARLRRTAVLDQIAARASARTVLRVSAWAMNAARDRAATPMAHARILPGIVALVRIVTTVSASTVILRDARAMTAAREWVARTMASVPSLMHAAKAILATLAWAPTVCPRDARETTAAWVRGAMMTEPATRQLVPAALEQIATRSSVELPGAAWALNVTLTEAAPTTPIAAREAIASV